MQWEKLAPTQDPRWGWGGWEAALSLLEATRSLFSFVDFPPHVF